MKKPVIILLAVFILFNLLIISKYLDSPLFQPVESEDSAEGIVSFTVINNAPAVIIHTPSNITYNFTREVNNSYPLLLNVSDNFGADVWRYHFLGLKNNNFEGTFGFNGSVPDNQSFVRWGNYLIVYGENQNTGANATATVLFYVHVNNTEPEFINLSDEYYFCEGTNFSLNYTAVDYDEDGLVLSTNPLVGIFKSFPESTTNLSYPGRLGVGGNTTAFNHVRKDGGELLTKQEAMVGLYRINLTAKDNWPVFNEQESAIRPVNITIIEVNRVPFLSVFGSNQTVETVWAFGLEDRTFYQQVVVNDTESGNQTSGNFVFNLTYQNGTPAFFGVSSVGVMNFTANTSLLGVNNSSQVYNMTLCVTDQALSNPHPNITDVCNQTGGSWKVCQNWTLTVTAQNRAPRIILYSPTNLSFSALRGQDLSFNVTTYDPDGTIPDIHWYVENSLEHFANGTSFSNFDYEFPCGGSGEQHVRAVVSDGNLSSSLQWNITLNAVDCLDDEGGGGGGGGGGGLSCFPLWECADWNVCETLDSGLGSGALVGEDYREVQEECIFNGWGGEVCGFQRRTCSDAANCGRTHSELLQSCYYTENPTCSDGITNCHDGSCEFLVDCGGPCGACATCSDGLQNQGEEQVDCGGPCPNACPIEIPGGTAFLNYLIALIIVILVGLVLFLVYRVRKEKQLER